MRLGQSKLLSLEPAHRNKNIRSKRNVNKQEHRLSHQIQCRCWFRWGSDWWWGYSGDPHYSSSPTKSSTWRMHWWERIAGVPSADWLKYGKSRQMLLNWEFPYGDFRGIPSWICGRTDMTERMMQRIMLKLTKNWWREQPFCNQIHKVKTCQDARLNEMSYDVLTPA